MPLRKTKAISASRRDGFLRITLSDLLSANLIHVISGLDDDDPMELHHCGTMTSIMGYTEWVGGDCGASISLGWDWCLGRDVCGGVTCMRVGLPRSNIMLVDALSRDYGWNRNLEVLATVVDAMPWADQTQRVLQQR